MKVLFYVGCFLWYYRTVCLCYDIVENVFFIIAVLEQFMCSVMTVSKDIFKEAKQIIAISTKQGPVQGTGGPDNNPIANSYARKLLT